MPTSKNKRLPASQVVLYLLLGLFALACVLPMVLIVIVSFSSDYSVTTKGFSFFPLEWTLEAWGYVGGFLPQLGRAYLVTIFETFVGTFWTLFLCSLFGYVLSRRSFKLNRLLSLFLLVTMLFGAPAMSSYVIKAGWYNLRNNLMVLFLPGVSAYACITMRTFIRSNIPDSLVESAKIDGASEFFIYFKIVLPLIVPICAANGFMTAVGHWNEWYAARLYLDNPNLASLQLVLMRIQDNLEYMKQNLENLSPEEMAVYENMPTTSTRMAILLITLGPILVAYPFFQKYFIKGMVVGAVKG